jgi:hypothetical protein
MAGTLNRNLFPPDLVLDGREVEGDGPDHGLRRDDGYGLRMPL